MLNLNDVPREVLDQVEAAGIPLDKVMFFDPTQHSPEDIANAVAARINAEIGGGTAGIEPTMIKERGVSPSMIKERGVGPQGLASMLAQIFGSLPDGGTVVAPSATKPNVVTGGEGVRGEGVETIIVVGDEVECVRGDGVNVFEGEHYDVVAVDDTGEVMIGLKGIVGGEPAFFASRFKKVSAAQHGPGPQADVRKDAVTKVELDFAPGDIVRCVVGNDLLVEGELYQVAYNGFFMGIPALKLEGFGSLPFLPDQFELFRKVGDESPNADFEFGHDPHDTASKETLAGSTPTNPVMELLREENLALCDELADANQTVANQKQRIQELLEANNREVERRREAESQVGALTELNANLVLTMLREANTLREASAVLERDRATRDAGTSHLRRVA